MSATSRALGVTGVTGRCQRCRILNNLSVPRASPLVYRLTYNGDVVAFKMGRRQGGPSRTGGRGRISESICNRRATPTPIFNATLRAAAGWLFFCVARSLRINLDILVAPPASLREAVL